jgi:hypothetical protein
LVCSNTLIKTGVVVLGIPLPLLAPFILSNSILYVVYIVFRNPLVVFSRPSFLFYQVVNRSLDSSFILYLLDFLFFVVFQIRNRHWKEVFPRLEFVNSLNREYVV